jgi:hypothetical protein
VFAVTYEPNIVGPGNSGACSVGSFPQAQTCRIEPGQTADLHYNDVGGHITVSSNGSHYPRNTFYFTAICHIEHNGNTGNIVVNDPAEGDIATCGKSDYPCR